MQVAGKLLARCGQWTSPQGAVRRLGARHASRQASTPPTPTIPSCNSQGQRECMRRLHPLQHYLHSHPLTAHPACEFHFFRVTAAVLLRTALLSQSLAREEPGLDVLSVAGRCVCVCV